MNEKTKLITNFYSCAISYYSPARIFGTSTGWKVAANPDAAYSSLAFGSGISAINSSGQLFSSGKNTYGTLGDNGTVGKSSPVQTISGGTNWQMISGDDARAALKTDGTLWMWGFAAAGSFGNDLATVDTSSPVQTVAGGTNWKQVSTFDWLTSATKTDGTLWIWGENNNGQLGNNDTFNRSSPVQTIGSATNWKAVIAGRCHTIALKTDSSLWSWGRNQSGRLGDNTTNNASSPIQTISGGTDWSKIESARITSFSIKTNGSLWAWGGAASGILGAGDGQVPQSSPVQVLPLGTNWKQVSGGHYSAAAVKNDGTLWVWGENLLSASIAPDPNSNREFVTSAVRENSFSNNWNEVAVSKQRGGQFSGGGWTAIKCDGTLWGTGQTYFGSFGNDKHFYLVLEEKDLGDVFVWKDCFTDAGMWLWGNGLNGVLGNNTTGGNRSSPVQTISGGSNWKEISVACTWAGGIKSDGTLWMWGNGFSGTLGTNSPIVTSSPVQTISGGTNWKRLSAGANGTSAIKTDGSLWNWGGANNLADNTTISKSSPVQTVSSGTNWKSVSAGKENSVVSAIKTDGSLWLWGDLTSGGIGGNNSLISVSSPIQTISAGTNWKCVDISFFAAATKTDGTLWLWGLNSNGQLSTNDIINRSSPVQTITFSTDWKTASVGSGFTATIKTDGTLWSWGSASLGVLGNSSAINRSSPVQTISGGSNWKSVTTGLSHASAIKNDGTLWNWGLNSSGQLGTNNTVNISSPAQTVAGGAYWKTSVAVSNSTVAIRESCW